MRTIHTGIALRRTAAGPALPGGAVAVDGDRITAVGPLAEVTAATPGARVRDWPGVLGPGLLADAVRELAAAPDPGSLRQAIHALLRRGVTTVPDAPADPPAVRAALDRAGLSRTPRTGTPGTGTPGTLTVGARADLAVFDPEGACLATVLAGRLVHRRV